MKQRHYWKENYRTIYLMHIAVKSFHKTLANSTQQYIKGIIERDQAGFVLGMESWLAAAKSLQSCLTLCDPIGGSPPGSPIPGILQARTLEWVAISFSNAWKWKMKAKSLGRPTLRNPMDCSQPGSSIHGIFPGKSTGVRCHCLLWGKLAYLKINQDNLLS